MNIAFSCRNLLTTSSPTLAFIRNFIFRLAFKLFRVGCPRIERCEWRVPEVIGHCGGCEESFQGYNGSVIAPTSCTLSLHTPFNNVGERHSRLESIPIFVKASQKRMSVKLPLSTRIPQCFIIGELESIAILITQRYGNCLLVPCTLWGSPLRVLIFI